MCMCNNLVRISRVMRSAYRRDVHNLYYHYVHDPRRDRMHIVYVHIPRRDNHVMISRSRTRTLNRSQT